MVTFVAKKAVAETKPQDRSRSAAKSLTKVKSVTAVAVPAQKAIKRSVTTTKLIKANKGKECGPLAG